MRLLFRIWLTVRRSGWFQPSMTGGIFPFPFEWQAWAITGAFVVLLLATIVLPHEIAVVGRIALCAAYIGIGFATYE